MPHALQVAAALQQVHHLELCCQCQLPMQHLLLLLLTTAMAVLLLVVVVAVLAVLSHAPWCRPVW
jgi:hypothetical protein